MRRTAMHHFASSDDHRFSVPLFRFPMALSLRCESGDPADSHELSAEIPDTFV
jgi:hypothetical protein